MLVTLLLAVVFQTFVIALVTIWTPLVYKWSLFENGQKFSESGKKGERNNGDQV